MFGCIADNITLKFEPAIETDMIVVSYTWNKDIGPFRDPSFAKFDGRTNSFYTFMDDIRGRILHSPENPTELNLSNLRISDAAKYNLVVRYENYTGNSPEFIVDLSVKGSQTHVQEKVQKSAMMTINVYKTFNLMFVLVSSFSANFDRL